MVRLNRLAQSVWHAVGREEKRRILEELIPRSWRLREMERRDSRLTYEQSRNELITIAFSRGRHLPSFIGLSRQFSKKPVETVPGILMGYHLFAQFMATLNEVARETGFGHIDAMHQSGYLTSNTISMCYTDRLYPISDSPALTSMLREMVQNFLRTGGQDPHVRGIPHFGYKLWQLRSRMKHMIPYDTIEDEVILARLTEDRVGYAKEKFWNEHVRLRYGDWIALLFKFTEEIHTETKHEEFTSLNFPIRILKSILQSHSIFGEILQEHSRGILDITEIGE